MALKLLAYSTDLGTIQRLIIYDDAKDQVAIVSVGDQWRVPEKFSGQWFPYWIVHSAVRNQEFVWISEPSFSKSGFWVDSPSINENELPQIAELLTQLHQRGELPLKSSNALSLLLRTEQTGEKPFPFVNKDTLVIKRRRKIAAIDVGTTKICTIMGIVDSNFGLKIVGVGIVPSRGLQKGMVVNVNEATESIRESVKKAEQSAGFKLESAYVGVTGRHITAVNNRGAIAITRNDRLVRGDDLKRVLDVARSVKVPSDHELLHVIPRTWVVDGQEGVKNPVGMHGFRLDVETHIITAAVTSIQNLIKSIRGVGIEIEDLVMEPLASAEAVLTDEEKQNGVILADIGGGTTDIAIFKDNSIYHTAVIPVAGNQITRDISVGLDLPYELAEEMKKKYGNVSPVKYNEADKIIGNNGHSVSYRDLCNIIRIRFEEIVRLVLLESPRTDYANFSPNGIVITGGCANLPGIIELIRTMTHLPVRIGLPPVINGLPNAVHDDPCYATSVGLILWSLNYSETRMWVSKPIGVLKFLSSLFRFHR